MRARLHWWMFFGALALATAASADKLRPEDDAQRVSSSKRRSAKGASGDDGGSKRAKPRAAVSSKKGDDKRDDTRESGRQGASKRAADSAVADKKPDDSRRGARAPDANKRNDKKEDAASRADKKQDERRQGRGSKPPSGSAREKSPDDDFLWGVVKKGDTFDSFARRYRTTSAEVRSLNRMARSLRLTPGARLRVREKSPTLTTMRLQPDLSRRAEARQQTEGEYVVHKVKKGDTLGKLADRYDVSPAEIIRLNGFGRRARIKPGTTIKVKRKPDQVLVGGVTLPVDERLYRRTRPDASWGTPGTIATIRKAYSDFMAEHPYSVLGVVADLSRAGGGYFPPHKSHRKGVDVDVGYFKIGNEQLRYLEVATPETLDVEKTWDLIRVFINTGHVTVIFMDIRLQAVLYDYLVRLGYDSDFLDALLQYPRGLGEKGGIIRHSPGHHHHLHIRFDCVDPNDPCTPALVAVIPDAPKSVAGLSANRPRTPPPAGSAAAFLRARAQLHVIEGDEDDTEIDMGDGGSTYHDPEHALIDPEEQRLYRMVVETSETSDWESPDLSGPGLCPRPEERPSSMARFGCTELDDDDGL